MELLTPLLQSRFAQIKNNLDNECSQRTPRSEVIRANSKEFFFLLNTHWPVQPQGLRFYVSSIMHVAAYAPVSKAFYDGLRDVTQQ
ncbi:hypothetical protein ACRZ5S_22795 (plasmid) [Vibrio scophthalmi]|uniref:hypothetical protein n=1 Tax=Vibrio scophthalmi TaxID=45658 RepID=UPI003EBD47B4